MIKSDSSDHFFLILRVENLQMIKVVVYNLKRFSSSKKNINYLNYLDKF